MIPSSCFQYLHRLGDSAGSHVEEERQPCCFGAAFERSIESSSSHPRLWSSIGGSCCSCITNFEWSGHSLLPTLLSACWLQPPRALGKASSKKSRTSRLQFLFGKTSEEKQLYEFIFLGFWLWCKREEGSSPSQSACHERAICFEAPTALHISLLIRGSNNCTLWQLHPRVR